MQIGFRPDDKDKGMKNKGMNDKQQLLTVLQEEFTQWEKLLASRSEEQITTPSAPQKPYNLSLKDVVAHLGAWQQVSLARAEAASLGGSPEFPAWLAGRDPDVDGEAELDQLNDSIYEAKCDQSWTSVHREWQQGFLRFQALAETFSERDLWDTERYPWLSGNSLAPVFLNSCQHHREHREQLTLSNTP